MKVFKIVAIVLVIAAIASGGTFWYLHRDKAPTYVTAPVTQGNISVSITGAGNLALSNTANVTFPMAGEVSSLLVDVGETVTKGQELLSLDQSYYQSQLNSLQEALLQAQKTEIQDQMNIQSAQTALTNVQTPYTSAQIAAALSTYENAAAAVEADQTALAGASGTAFAQDTARLNADEITAASDYATYETEATATADPNQVALAQVNLQIAQSALADAQNAVTTAQQAVTAASNTPTGLFAPFAGIVTSLTATAGTTYPANSVAMVIANTAIVTDTIQVSEANIFKIKMGQAATVTVSSTGASYPATITFISSSATTTSGVVSYRVTVTLTQSGASAASIGQLKAGLTANVDMIVAQSTNALLVPNAAVTTVNGVSTVQLMGTDGKVTTQNVTTGLSDLNNTEITAGLSLGEKVVIPQAKASSSSSTSSGNNILQPTQTTSTGSVVITQAGGGGFTPPSGGGVTTRGGG